MKNILYRILRYFAKEYLKRYLDKHKKWNPESDRITHIKDAILIIKIEEAWEVYNREIKKIKP